MTEAYYSDIFELKPCAPVSIPDTDMKTDIRLIGYNECATRFLAKYKLNDSWQFAVYSYNMILEEFSIGRRHFIEMMFLR